MSYKIAWIDERSRIAIPIYLVLFVSLLCTWGGLGGYGILSNNEGLYAEIAREMLASGNWHEWIIPHLNGLLYMEKPPLLYWLTAMVFALFGQAEYAVRLIPSVSGLACVGFLLHLGQRIQRPQTGRLAALMFISGLGVMLMTRTLMFDMLLAACLCSALSFAYLFERDGKCRDLRIAYISLALALLAKGFVAIALFGLVVLSWLVLIHGKSVLSQLKRWFDPVSVGLFLAIAVPWHLTACLIEPSFAWFYFVNEHILRFLGQRLPHDYYAGKWWYYLPRMVIYLFPWSLFIPALLIGRPSQQYDKPEKDLKKLLCLSWIIPTLFFSVSSAKANYYLVIVMPFAAFHLSMILEQHDFLRGRRSLVIGVLVAVIAIIAALWLQFLVHLKPSDLLLLGLPWPVFARYALWCMAGLSLLAGSLAWRFPVRGIVFFLLLSLYTILISLIVVKGMESRLTDRPMAEFIVRTLPNRPVYIYRQFEQNSSLPFYLKRRVFIVDSVSNDLFWGNKLRPFNKIMVSQAQLSAVSRPVVVVVMDSYLAEFKAKNLQTRFLYSQRFDKNTVFY